MYLHHMCAWCSWWPEEGVRSSRTGVIGGFEPHVGAENQTLVPPPPKESNKCHLSSPQDFFNSLKYPLLLAPKYLSWPKGRAAAKEGF